jgi:hypothetical protein
MILPKSALVEALSTRSPAQQDPCRGTVDGGEDGESTSDLRKEPRHPLVMLFSDPSERRQVGGGLACARRIVRRDMSKKTGSTAPLRCGQCVICRGRLFWLSCCLVRPGSFTTYMIYSCERHSPIRTYGSGGEPPPGLVPCGAEHPAMPLCIVRKPPSVQAPLSASMSARLVEHLLDLWRRVRRGSERVRHRLASKSSLRWSITGP